MKKIDRWIGVLLLTFTLPFFLASDCGGGDTPTEVKKLLYVLDNTNDAVYVIEGIDTIDGAFDAARTIEGDKTLIINPTAIDVDSRRDILYVADANQALILVFAPASQRDGNVEPARTLPVGGNPQSMSLDEVGNRLYVFDASNLSVKVWDNVSSADGVVPDRTFTIGFLASTIFIDRLRDFLYVGDPIGFAIQVYSEASRTIGTPFPARVILNAEGEFSRIDSISMNIDNDLLFASDSLATTVEIFPEASTLNGEVTPDRVLEGDSTGLTDKMRQLLFHDNVLYLNQNDTTIGIWNDANTIDGNTSPDRLVTVNPATRIKGFDIDLQH